MTNIIRKRMLLEILTVVIGIVVALIPAPAGLGQNAMWTMGILVWAIANWITKSMPDVTVIVIMLCLWSVFKIVPFTTAFSAFSGSTFWLLVGVFTLSAAISKSGLLKRMSLMIMRLFPPTFKGQVMAMIGTGMVIGPFIPSSMAKISLTGPMAADIGRTLGFEPHSKGMTGMFLSMYTGFSLLAPTFISASFFGYMILALMPESVQKQFTWVFWLVAMLVWAIVVMVGSYFAITKLYSPKNTATMSKDLVNKQIETLGPVSLHEKITLLVLVICVLFWVFESATGIPAVIPAVIGGVLLIAAGVLAVSDLSACLPWNILIFSGGVMGIAGALGSVKITDWIGSAFGGPMGALIANPYVFVLAGTVIFTMLRFVLVDHMSAFTLFIVVLLPFAVASGVTPMLVGIVAYVNVMPFFVYYQNIQFVVAYEGFGGDKMAPFTSVSMYYFVYMAISTAGLLLTVPYWTVLGLL